MVKNDQHTNVFVSSFDITLLRDTEQYLLHTFFDRIAQLVTKLPSFKDSDRNIYEDFNYMGKNEFDEKSKCQVKSSLVRKNLLISRKF